jgi:hypothetical protein
MNKKKTFNIIIKSNKKKKKQIITNKFILFQFEIKNI